MEDGQADASTRNEEVTHRILVSTDLDDSCVTEGCPAGKSFDRLSHGEARALEVTFAIRPSPGTMLGTNVTRRMAGGHRCTFRAGCGGCRASSSSSSCFERRTWRQQTAAGRGTHAVMVVFNPHAAASTLPTAFPDR